MGVILESFVSEVEAADPLVRTDPQFTAIVFHYCVDHGIGKSLGF